MIVKAAQHASVDGGGDELHELLNAGAQIGAPQHFQEDGLGKFHRCPIMAAQEDVVALAHAQGGDVELDGFGLAAHVAVEQDWPAAR